MIGRRPIIGTRFNLFLQPPDGGSEPLLETVTVSSPAGSIGPGPQDDFMYTIETIGNTEPYGVVRDNRGRYLHLPPWDGPIAPPVEPDADGHFDYLFRGGLSNTRISTSTEPNVFWSTTIWKKLLRFRKYVWIMMCCPDKDVHALPASYQIIFDLNVVNWIPD